VDGGILAGPNLEEYRERLKGFAMDLSREEDGMEGVYMEEEHNADTDLGELYNFRFLPEQKYDTGFMDPFLEQATQTTQNTQSTFPPAVSPFSGGPATNVPTTNELNTGEIKMVVQGQGHMEQEQIPDFLFDEGELSFRDFEDLFGDMPNMPGLDGAIDQGFLEFLGNAQP
jgi:hypothetical protein